jgi:hypothetical protein
VKTEELVAQSFLASTYAGRLLEFEPDGVGTTPDFLLDGKIAIEVRRLNVNHIPEGLSAVDAEGLENDFHNITDKLDKLCRSIPKIGDKQYYLEVTIIGRPVDHRWLTPRWLAAEYAGSNGKPFTSESGNFQFDWIPRKKPDDGLAIAVGAFMDQTSGSWIIENYEKNISIAIEKKWQKALKSARPNADWWLVLVDHIFPGSSFLAKYNIKPDFKGFCQVIVIDRSANEVHRYTK